MSKSVKRLSHAILKEMILQEAIKLKEEITPTEPSDVEKVAKKTKEVDADEFASEIELDVDWIKALDIQEAKLVKKLQDLSKAVQQGE